jgi:DNA-3-methyladenine glycosylase II
MTTTQAGSTNVVRFTLEPVAPFRLDLTAWALRRRPDNVVDRLEDGTYRRVIVSNGGPVGLAVRQVGDVDSPRLEVEAAGSEDLGRIAEESLVRLLGLSVDMAGFRRLAAADPNLGPLAARLRGIRPPRYPSAFEALVNAVACQQITLTLGIRVLNRVVEAYGPTLGGAHAFPRPEDLAGADPGALRALGLSTQKARTVVEAAQRVASGALDLDGLASLDDESAIARLVELRGVGRWTAEYVLLRGLGRVHVFPGDDSGLRRGLARWLDLPTLDLAGTRELLARWHPYAGLVYLCLLANSLIAAGHVRPSDEPPDLVAPNQ